MLDDLIAKIKGKFSKSDGGAEENDPMVPSAGKPTIKAEANEEDKKKSSPILKILIILGFGYVALDQFVLNTEEEGLPETEVKKPVRKAKKIPTQSEATQEASQQTIQDTTPVVTPADSPESEPPVQATPAEQVAEEEIVIPPMPEEKKEPPQEAEKIGEADSSGISPDAPQMEPEKPEKTLEDVIAEANAELAETEKEAEAETAPEDGAKEDSATKKESDQLSEVVFESDLKKILEEVKILEKKESKMERIAPPDYEEFGRGLVYNCKGKHWACVNFKAYQTCRDNFKWAKFSKEPIECVSVNVYASAKDCRTVQVYNINRVKETPFCQ